jgi:hypothetical protein
MPLVFFFLFELIQRLAMQPNALGRGAKKHNTEQFFRAFHFSEVARAHWLG